MRQQGMFDAARLVFIDETWTSTSMVRLRGRCRRGERLIGYAPQGHWKVITFVAGLRERAMVAPFVLEGAMNGPMFLAYVRQCVVPILKRGEIVISIIFQPTKWLASGRRSKRRVRRCFTSHRIRQTSTRFEPAFSKFKAHLRKAAERTIPRLLRRIGCAVRSFSPQECRNFFRHAGYVQT